MGLLQGVGWMPGLHGQGAFLLTAAFIWSIWFFKGRSKRLRMKHECIRRLFGPQRHI